MSSNGPPSIRSRLDVPAPWRILFIPDVHAPNHHRPSWNLMRKAARIFRPHIMVVLGDFPDLESLSAHDPHTSRGRRFFKDELGEVRTAVDELDDIPGVLVKRWVKGNHDFRLDRFIANQAPQLDGMVSIEKELDLRERGWDITEYNQTFRLGKLNITHDTGTAGMNAHRTAANDLKGSAIIGHTHRMAYDVIGRPNGEPNLAAMFGWLGDPNKITYVHRSKAKSWVHGFGVGYMQRNGIVHVQPVPIIQHSCCIGGKIITL